MHTRHKKYLLFIIGILATIIAILPLSCAAPELIPVLSPPAVLASQGDYAGFIKITVSFSHEPSGFFVYRSHSKNGPYELIATVQVSSITDTGTTPQHPLYVAVYNDADPALLSVSPYWYEVKELYGIVSSPLSPPVSGYKQ